MKTTLQLFFLDFGSSLGKGEEIFKYVLYKARVVDCRRAISDIVILVYFVDFGNVEWISMFKCKNLDKKYLGIVQV